MKECDLLTGGLEVSFSIVFRDKNFKKSSWHKASIFVL